VSITVEVRGGNLEKAMRVLKKKVQKSGLIKEVRDRKYYQKPSEIKREKAKERSKIIRKAQKVNDEMLGYKYVKGVKVKKI
jgi:small subunit ribosomal protein S21|tara:strand:- start:23784 stop:24026 length:243 start_codon:yes stop_codon:yes gene_type:complete